MSGPRIMIGKVDVTEHVAAMFDALVGSLDWGSGFLDVETIESILIICELAGFSTNRVIVAVDVPGMSEIPPLPPWHGHPRIQMPAAGPSALDEPGQRIYEEQQSYDRAVIAHTEAACRAIDAWRAQVQAKARAMAGGDS